MFVKFSICITSHPIRRTFDFSLRFKAFLDLGSLHAQIKLIIPGAEHSPPMIDLLLNFLSANKAIIFATLVSLIEIQ